MLHSEILDIVFAGEGRTVAEIARASKSLYSTVYRKVQNLVHQKYLIREMNQDDRRCMLLSITKEGRRVRRASNREVLR